jgi:hypothetical protein
MERVKIDTEEEYGKMWETWLIFQKSDNTTNSIQIKKQLGILRLDQNFSFRRTRLHSPSIQELFEAVLTGILQRNEKRLFKSRHSFLTELQNSLQELIKTHLPKKVNQSLYYYNQEQ